MSEELKSAREFAFILLSSIFGLNWKDDPDVIVVAKQILARDKLIYDRGVAWTIARSRVDDVAVELLAGVILSRDKLIEETAFRKAASYLRGLRKTPAGGFDLYHTEMQVLAKVADGLERASLSILLSAPGALDASANTSSISVDHLSKIEPDEIDLERDVRKPSSGPGRSGT